MRTYALLFLLAMNPLIATPPGFARCVLGMHLTPKQEAVLWDLDKPGRVAAKCCNGAGKTQRMVVAAMLWHACTFPNSLCVDTAGVFRQVKDQLWPALRGYAKRFRGWQFNETDFQAPNGSRAIGFSTDDPEKFEGWHSENLLMVIDEAKSVPDSIYEAAERCQANRWLVLSSPGFEMGEFFNCFTSRSKFYRTHTIRAEDCPWITPGFVSQQIEMRGENHPLIRSMIHAEFMETNSVNRPIIPLPVVERVLNHPPQFKNGERHAFCDFAAGGDENVLARREGNRILPLDTCREKNTMTGIGWFITLFRRYGLEPSEISGDNDGLGRVMIDALAEAGWEINRVHGNSAPLDRSSYLNNRSETWYEGGRALERNELILPADDILKGQLATCRGKPNSKGLLQAESKEEMAKRGVDSPDRADAVLGCARPTPGVHSRNYAVSETFEDILSPVDDMHAGFHAG